jgi:hypothetical protein
MSTDSSYANNPRLASPAYRASWPLVLGLIGLDYFSTLAYQPSIAFESAGLLAPLATTAIVLLTLLGALPVYAYVAGRSPPGHGSAAMLERLIEGWRGKFAILVLLGFAATNFIFTRTLSTADASVHILNHPNAAWQQTLDNWAEAGIRARPMSDNPIWQAIWGFWDRQLVTTLLLLAVYFVMWPIVWRGFTRRMVQLSLVLVCGYLLLTAVIIGSGLLYLAKHQALVDTWWSQVRTGQWGISKPVWAGGDAWSLVKMCLWLLPKMALGLSGFEMSLVAMPVIRGEGRAQVVNTRKLLLVSALAMAGLLIGSALVTTLLMLPASMLPGGAARERALAYLAHGGELAPGILPDDVNPLFGRSFGTIYDVMTVVVLCLAGASVTSGLKGLLPQFLLRFGMELRWAYSLGLIYQLCLFINFAVTMLFRASVDNQRSAYAVSVLALLTSAAAASALDLRRRGGIWKSLLSLPFALVALVFTLMGCGIVVYHPGSVGIAGLFIAAIISTSMASRMWRAREFRFEGFEFESDATRGLWDKVRHLEYSVLVPIRPGGRSDLDARERLIRARHRVGDDVPVIFLEVELGDPSDFLQRPLMAIREEPRRFLIKVTRCVSSAHVIVAVGLEFSKVGEPPEIHFGWSDQTPLAANLKFLLFGEGNVPWLVQDLLRRIELDHARRPRVIVG